MKILRKRNCTVFQIHKSLQRGNVCFINTKYLCFVSSAILHYWTSLRSFANLLLNVMNHGSQRPDLFEQRVMKDAWFNFEDLVLLWDLQKNSVQGMKWNLCKYETENRFLKKIELALQHAAQISAGNHTCVLCEVPVRSRNGKWNILSKICNNRSLYI